MSYRILPSQLHETADAALAWFRTQRGITSFRVEEPIANDIEFVPTLSKRTRDHYTLCVEVSEKPYTTPLDSFVLECKNRVVPVKLFVVIPSGKGDSMFKDNLKRAQRNGVGVIEVDGNGGAVIHEALALSLTGVRAPDPADFPNKYRQALAEALSTFRNGDPVKGCGRLYDELEDLTRRIASKVDRKRAWKEAAISQAASVDFSKAPWAMITNLLLGGIEQKILKSPQLTGALLARVYGVTSHRNESGHKPANRAALTRRDRELRTRFETASDLLRDLVAGVRPLRI